jgi:hypothetical protein
VILTVAADNNGLEPLQIFGDLYWKAAQDLRFERRLRAGSP